MTTTTTSTTTSEGVPPPAASGSTIKACEYGSTQHPSSASRHAHDILTAILADWLRRGADYTMLGAPNPVIVDLAAGELGVDLSGVDREVDLMGMENRNPEFLKMNPAGGLPFIELHSGTCISETVAIAAYLEDAESTNGVSLFGKTAEERGNVRQWSRRVEQQIAIPIMCWFRWGAAKDVSSPRLLPSNCALTAACVSHLRHDSYVGTNCLQLFKGRGIHGLLASDDAAAMQLAAAKEQLKWLNGLMGSNDYIVGEFSICDCILFGQVWFFCFNPGFGAPLGPLLWEAEDLKDDIPWLKAWYKRVEARPVTAKLLAKYAAAQAAVAAAAIAAEPASA